MVIPTPKGRSIPKMATYKVNVSQLEEKAEPKLQIAGKWEVKESLEGEALSEPCSLVNIDIN